MAILTDVYVEEADDLLALGEIVDEILVRKQAGRHTYYRTRRHGSLLVRTAKRINVWIEAPAPEVSRGVVFRLLAKRDENALQDIGAILPRNYFGEVTAEGHIRNGGRSRYAGSRFLSTSRNLEGIYAYIAGLLKCGVGREERLAQLCESSVIAIVDVCRLHEAGIRCIDAVPLMKGPLARNFAKAVREVLVDGEIPESCLRDLTLLKPEKLAERR